MCPTYRRPTPAGQRQQFHRLGVVEMVVGCERAVDAGQYGRDQSDGGTVAHDDDIAGRVVAEVLRAQRTEHRHITLQHRMPAVSTRHCRRQIAGVPAMEDLGELLVRIGVVSVFEISGVGLLNSFGHHEGTPVARSM